MTLKEAAKILNAHRHHGCDDWQVRRIKIAGDDVVAGAGVRGDGPLYRYYWEDALIIAQYYLDHAPGGPLSKLRTTTRMCERCGQAIFIHLCVPPEAVLTTYGKEIQKPGLESDLETAEKPGSGEPESKRVKKRRLCE